MPTPLRTLDSVFPPWKDIADKYDAICTHLSQHYQSEEERAQKQESIHWEQTAFELLVTVLLSLQIPFDTGAGRVQQIIQTLDGKDKEIDFSLSINNFELYFGVTSFSDSEKDFAKDVEDANIPISNLKRSDGVVSDAAAITSVRSQRNYVSRRLVVRVATEGKHRLASDYIYMCFPKLAPGFGGGLDAMPADFSFDAGLYTYPENGITGLIVVGEYLSVEPKRQSIQHDVWQLRTKVFPHASETARTLLRELDGINVDMRPRFAEIRRLLDINGPNMFRK
jgi:hypothetical protein